MSKIADLTGRRFGRLVVVRQDGADCDCMCDSGKHEARLMFRGEFVLMKHFDTFPEAVKARQDAENKYLKPLRDAWEPDPAELAEKQLVTADQAAKIISLRCGVNYTKNAVVGLIKAGKIAGVQEIKNTLCVPAQWATSYLPLKSRTRKGAAKK